MIFQDRCHRIGQTKAVTVYKLVTSNTVDEDIFEMGERKRQLSAAVLEDIESGSGDKRGKAKQSNKPGHDDDLDMGSIARILQKA